jgi:hypothetical protein
MPPEARQPGKFRPTRRNAPAITIHALEWFLMSR